MRLAVISPGITPYWVRRPVAPSAITWPTGKRFERGPEFSQLGARPAVGLQRAPLHLVGTHGSGNQNNPASRLIVNAKTTVLKVKARRLCTVPTRRISLEVKAMSAV